MYVQVKGLLFDNLLKKSSTNVKRKQNLLFNDVIEGDIKCSFCEKKMYIKND